VSASLRARPRLDRAFEPVMLDFDLRWYPAEELGDQLLIYMPDGRDVLASREDFEVHACDPS
jgi:hypothetical protein